VRLHFEEEPLRVAVGVDIVLEDEVILVLGYLDGDGEVS